jgi:lipoprotein-anchoring transpeptidase ErfK/SrfK
MTPENRRTHRILAAATYLFTTLLIAPAALAGTIVPFDDKVAPGTILIKTSERRLYLVLDDERAVRYSVGVGKAGMQWSGRSSITGKFIKPDFVMPNDLRRKNTPAVIPAGSPRNPLGAAALTLHEDYAIHGTNQPGSVGGFVSHGCIRMHNRDVMDLYRRVSVGTPVIVTR